MDNMKGHPYKHHKHKPNKTITHLSLAESLNKIGNSKNCGTKQALPHQREYLAWIR